MIDMSENFKPIRSFVIRQGRMSNRQQLALDNEWTRFGVEFSSEHLVFEQLFGRKSPVVLEIGFGMGKSLALMAKVNPDNDYLGIEVHTPGVGSLLADLVEQGSTNVRIIQHDAVEVLKQQVADNSLELIQIFFPDPWHKKRHHKRRLIQTEFVELLVSKLNAGGKIHCATDWQDYAEQMMSVLSANERLKNTAGMNQYSPRPDSRPVTKFEQRGQRLGHGVWDLIFELEVKK